ncbi:short-chain fatty acyl-CoA regulator family protein [Sphingosinicella sp. LHD-64]|uniref:helix-turn-helix domain-containing protein n=1 Tax=Sphingosinicella sp. LHD-64 TaxID=3072139 RepID=UPI00280E3EB5|nr:short-chain fatty acyl-CoA regulator family protein [Sphingosinicella sp. LHD-64]MDQ8758085.1 short-chain fatty acyl-CoA regulator family protein [Sphingosinicella sp. LHD-64]
MSAPRRLFAGARARALRGRLGLSQSAMAARVGLSVSYLSQLESDDRPMTDAVLAAFSRAFPSDWAEIGPDDHAALVARAAAAANDPTVPGALAEDALLRGVARQPLLAERLVAVHDAYRRSQDQLRSLDDALERGTGGGMPLPWDEVREWFHDAGNYVDAIDRAAERLAREVGPDGIGARLAEHGVELVIATGAELRSFDPATRRLAVDRSIPPESRLFQMAHQLMRLELADTIAGVAGNAGLHSPESVQLLSVGLANYAAGAFLMPYAPFRAEARRLRHDIDALRQVFGVSFEQACHRLSTLQRPGAAGIPFYFCRVDMAGNITKRHSATRLQFARFGGACPLWMVHEAVAIPDRILVQLAETPDGVRYVSMAKGLVKPSGSYARPSRRYAVALGCEAAHAADFIYADQLDLSGAGSATPIGVSCRICPRENCDQRAFPPAGRALSVDPDRRAIVPYGFA